MAAGLGFKTFTTGEVLTAADTNGYLMQGVLVFASSAARAAAITSPQEGQYSYLKDTNSTEYYDGAAWIAAPIGDITGVTAGTGISGGGTSGTVTITNDMATTITAAGDIVVGTGSGTYDNLPIGTTAQVLTADTTVSPYKVKWATPASGGGTWVSYTPTLTNITLGNGTMTSFYNNDGKTVNYAFYIKWGSTTSGAGNYSFSIPVAADTTLGDNSLIGTQANGSGVLWDNSASGPYVAQVMLTSSTTCRIFSLDLGTFPAGASQQRASTTTPMTWATNDIIIGFITYKAA